MKVYISIECEDKNEIIQHLEAIKEQINKDDYHTIDLETEEKAIFCITLEDVNCYGTHVVEILEIEKEDLDENLKLL